MKKKLFSIYFKSCFLVLGTQEKLHNLILYLTRLTRVFYFYFGFSNQNLIKHVPNWSLLFFDDNA